MQKYLLYNCDLLVTKVQATKGEETNFHHIDAATAINVIYAPVLGMHNCMETQL